MIKGYLNKHKYTEVLDISVKIIMNSGTLLAMDYRQGYRFLVYINQWSGFGRELINRPS